MIDSKTPLSPTQSSPPESPDQVTEAFAARLMDELFEDLERALEGDEAALASLTPSPLVDTPPIAQSDATELTLSFSEGGLPAVLVTTGEEHAIAPLTLAPATDTPSEVPVTAPKPSFWNLNRVMWVATGITLLATLGLWLYQRQQAMRVETLPAPAMAPETTTAHPQAEFLEYLRRSLEVIAQNAPSAGAEPSPVALSPGMLPPGTNSIGLPSVSNPTFSTQPVPGTIATAPNQVSVIERVYIPYPTSQTAAPLPTATPTSATPPATSPPPAATSTPAPLVASLKHKLVGVLELGDRSAALFEVDGVPQRVYIGERIASSGWSLVSVANNEVMIRRNGEVRALYIGQQF